MPSIVVILIFCCGVPQLAQESTAYDTFLAAVGDGADCRKLHALRKRAQPSSSVAEQTDMTRLLRSAGCITSTSERALPGSEAGRPQTYTVREYRIYREVVDAPHYMAETQVIQMTARKFKTTASRVKATAEKVTRILSRSDWAGSRAAEERHASDWAKK
jgi:hypothetical protein